MQIVIDIPEGVYEDIVEHDGENREGAKSAYYFEKVIQNGTPLPKGHGRLIDADALFDYFGNDALDEVTRSNIEYFINETNGIIIKADKSESEET